MRKPACRRRRDAPRGFLLGPLALACLLWSLLVAVSTARASNYLTSPPWALNTHAGYTGVGRADGPALSASFDGPSAVAVDAAGNIYIADTFNSTIRRLAPDGTVSTYAGTPGVAGVADGEGVQSRFNLPAGLVAAADGTLYVADTGNHLIRRVSASGQVTTLAGAAGQSGSTDATGAAARFFSPVGLALDATAGVLYVADTGNHVVRRIVLSTGAVTTLAGTAVTTGSNVNATGAAARFQGPIALALSADRAWLYVADFEGHTLRRIDVSTREVITLAGSPGLAGSADASGNLARFDKPQGLALSPAGHLLVADTNGCRIRQVTTAGAVTTLAGGHQLAGSVDAVGANARFNQPQGLAYDAVGARLVVADALNAQVRALNLAGLAVTTIAGRPLPQGAADGAASAARFREPHGVARDNAGNLYVADRLNHTLRKISAGGAVTTLAGLAGSSGVVNAAGSAARFHEPIGVAVLGDGSLVYVSDFAAGTVRRVTAAGEVTTLASGFNQPAGLALDSSGNVYVAEFGAHLIRRVTPAGVVSTFAGASGQSGSANGSALVDARFFQPFGVAVDSSDHVYVADFGNQTIRKITPQGAVTTLAGLAGDNGSTDATGSAARFFFPAGVAVDSSGNVYVSDYGNHLVRRVAPDGAVRTFVGTPGAPGGADGVASSARLRNPRGIAVDPATGRFFVADAGNHAIRSGAPAPAPVITSAAAASGTVAATFTSYAITAQNGALSFGASGLPAGLAINTETGLITGTPLFAGVYPVILTAENLSGVGDLSAVFTIAKAPATVSLSNLAIPFDGSPKTPTATTTPAGLAVTFTFNGSATAPSAYGDYTVVATIQDANRQGSATATFSITAPTTWSVSTVAASGPLEVRGLALDGSGNLYLADAGRHVIWRRTPAGVLSVYAGAVDQVGPAAASASLAAARFREPSGLAFDASGNLYVADTGNHCIRRISSDGTAVTLFAGSGDEFDFDWVDDFGAAARFYRPVGLVAVSGFLYVADSGNGILRRVNLSNVSVEYLVTDPTQFDQPFGLTAGPDGTLYFTTVGENHRVWRVTPGSETATALAGNGARLRGQSDGTGANALFDTPSAIAYGSDGALYVADTANHTLRRVTLGGVVTTIAGLADQSGSTDGLGQVARLFEPSALLRAGDGSLWVAELGGELLASPAPRLRLASPPPVPPVFSSPSTFTLTELSAATGLALAASGSPTSYAASGLPAGLSLNSSTGALTGTPAASGIYNVTVSATNSLTTTYQSVTLTVNAPAWTAWRSARFSSAQLSNAAISGPAADPDADGVANLFEYLDGRDPLLRDAMPPAIEAANGYLTMTYTRLRVAPGWAIHPEISVDLATWQRGAAQVETASVTILDSRRERVVVRTPLPTTLGPRRFLRLQAEATGITP